MTSQSQCGFRCRPRFKGIETFLRRVAFNLGNSPSQTEVKIISCIPIDVTDLQHRIVTLERELEQYHQKPEAAAAVCTALGGTAHHRGEPPGPLPEDLTPNSTSTSQDKSNPSLQYHTSEHQEFFPRPVSAPRISEVPVTDNYYSRTRNDEPFYRKKIKLSKKKKSSKPRTELIYFAQQDVKSPFDQTQSTSKDTPIENMLSHGYLADIARKQCRSERIPLNQSEFSSPICRDNGSATPHRRPVACESDVCSCCRGHFHDVDASRRAYSRYDMPSAPNDLSMYYDSSMYDLVPVKEKRDDINPKKKENIKEQLKCNHGQIYRSRMQPYTVTYSNGAIRNGRRLVGKRKTNVKSPNRIPKRKYEQFAVDQGFSSKRSEKLYQDMELQTYYMRPMRKAKQPSPPKTPHVEQKNAECLTMNFNNTECQTASTKSIQLDIPPPPAQTNNEATLNQIKTILQTVLTEVKTNVREKIQETQKVQEDQKVQETQKAQESVKTESKKDAVVQKGVSQRNIEACSTLLNSFYYSPYSMNPMNPYSAASCAPPQCYPNGYYPPTMKCFQNYPLFIQTTGRPCDLCSKKPPTTTKASHGKHAANTATNTDSLIKSQHSKETEKLIKEIYKSIAVNFDITSKEATTSEGDDLKSEPSKYNFNRKSNESKQRESVTVKSPRTKDTAATPLYMNPTFNSARTSDEVSVHSTRVATRNEGILRTVNLLTQPQDSASEKSEEKRWNRKKTKLPAQSESDKTESVDVDATESEVTVIPVRKKERSSLLTKVRNVFKGRIKKNSEIQHSVTESEHDEHIEEYEESDSDYQTVYSDRSVDNRRTKTVTAAPVHLPAIREHRHRRLSHSKVAYPRYVPVTRASERPRRPYMEQEYRRQWNEGISFRCPPSRSARHAHEPRSGKLEHQYAGSMPTYWRNYEARHAYIEHDVEPHEESPQTEEQEDYEIPRRRRNRIAIDEEDKPKVFKAVAKKLQWFKKCNLPECRHTWKKLLVDS